VKPKIGFLLRKWQVPALMATGLLPLALLMGVHWMNGQPWLGALPLGIYMVGTMLCLLLPGRWRMVFSLLLSAGIFASGMLLPWEEEITVLLAPIVCGVLVQLTLPMAGWSEEPKIHPVAAFSGVAAHGMMQLMQIAAQNSGDPERYAGILPVVWIDFVVFCALLLVTLNRHSLRDATLGGRRAPAAMRRKNMLLSGGLLAVTLLIGCMPAVIDALTKLYSSVVNGAVWLFMTILRLFHGSGSDGSGGGGGGEMDLAGLLGGPEPPNPFMKIMEKVAIVLALAGAAALLIVALYFLGKKIWRLVKKLWIQLSRYVAAASEDYQDEVVDTREKGEVLRAFVRQLRPKRDPLKKVDESKLSPVERIRYRYLKLWLNHPYWSEGATARENLTDAAAADLYDRARYSDHPVTAGDADEFARRVAGK